MENFVRFQWYDAGTELKRNIGFLYKYGDNIYEKLVTKLEEYGFERSGSKKLYHVDYNDECVLIEDSDTLWSVMHDPNQVSGQPVRLETLEKPRKPRYCSGRDDRCTEAPNETAASAAADSGAVTTGDVTAAATERPPEERPQAIAKTRRRLSRRRARSRSRSRAGTRSHTRSRTRSRSRSRSRGHRMESRGGTRSRSHTRSRSRSRSHSRGRRSHRYQRLHRLGQHHRSAPKHRASHRTPPLERRDLSSTSDSDYAAGERHGASSRTLGELMKRLERVEAKLDKLISTTAPATR